MRKLGFLSAILLAACAAHGGAQSAAQADLQRATPSSAAAGPNDTLARIHALIGTPSCTEDSQCRSLAIGARPCGGPEGFLAYSTARSSETELQALSAIYQAERRKANTQSGRVSDCRALMDPGAVCRAGSCVPAAPQALAR
jgi:hypothetical protein